jgi:DNA-binding IscR family transcriptional regulator
MATSVEVAHAIGSHPVVIRRLLGILRSSGIVESRRGPGGGWAIARDPTRVRLSEIYRALAAGADDASARQTAIDQVLASADAAYLARLADFSLADL